MSASGERALWLSVIALAIEDASAIPLGERRKDGDSRHFGDPRDIEAARKWLEGDSKDFHTVCALAGVHPDDVRRRYQAREVADERVGRSLRRRIDAVRAAELYAAGLSLREIGLVFGTRHVEGVRQALLRQGVTLRSPHARHAREYRA